MAYGSKQRCPWCEAEHVVFGLFHSTQHPGAADGIDHIPVVTCTVCGKTFNAVESTAHSTEDAGAARSGN